MPSNVSNAPRNNNFRKSASSKATCLYSFQTRAWLECDLAQARAEAERALSKCLNTAGDYQLLDISTLEPSFPYNLETVREAEHLRILLTEPELFRRHLHLRRDFQVFDFRSPETQLPELLDVFVYLETLECTAGSERCDTYLL